MSDDFPDPRRLQERAARRLQRREELRRRTHRQRRLAAAGAVVLIGLTVGAIVLSGGGTARPVGATARHRHRGWKPYVGPVPILEYHVLGRPQVEVAYPQLYVPRASFRK